MDSRIFYIVFRRALPSVAWDKHGENEYVLVGDGDEVDLRRLQSLVEQTFSDSVLCYPESRREKLEIPISDAAAFLAKRLTPKGMVTVSSLDAKVFLQVHGMGVARTGRSRTVSSQS